MKEFMTVQEAAKYLGTTRQKMSRLIARGFIATSTNPLDTRQRLISMEQLESLKVFQTPESEADNSTNPNPARRGLALVS